MSDLITADQLAAQFGISVEQVHKFRLKKQWPCVKFGRNDVRFTPAQVEQIVDMQTRHAAPAKPKIVGQTKGSKARSA